MVYLIVVSILWAVSFGLIPFVSPLGADFVAAARIVLSLAVFAPMLRLRGVKPSHVVALAGIGALEFGLMYVLYIRSYRWLNPAEVALFTIFTPLFVTLADDLLERRISWLFLATAGIAVAGTAICLWTELERSGLLTGFLVMQCSNACFALGQVLYRRLAPAIGRSDHQLMPILYAGAAIVACAAAASTLDVSKLSAMTARQAIILVYLGAIASGVGFFLFNAGARRTDVGALAIFNNAKVPLAIAASAFIFGAPIRWANVLCGGVVIAGALVLNEWVLRSRHK